MKPAINPEQEIKRLKRQRTYWIVSWSILFLTVILLASIQYILIPQKHEVKIDYGDLDKEQQTHAAEVISDVKEPYLIVQKSITFTTKEIKREVGKDSLSAKITVGTNDQTGNIRVMYKKDDYALRATLCHELLHSFFRIDEYSHDVIYDVEKYLPCFKSNGKVPRAVIVP